MPTIEPRTESWMKIKPFEVNVEHSDGTQWFLWAREQDGETCIDLKEAQVVHILAQILEMAPPPMWKEQSEIFAGFARLLNLCAPPSPPRRWWRFWES